MISAADVKTLKRLLLCTEGAKAFAPLDGAAQPDLLATLMHYQPEHYCLLRGALAPDLAAVAPYLVEKVNNILNPVQKVRLHGVPYVIAGMEQQKADDLLIMGKS